MGLFSKIFGDKKSNDVMLTYVSTVVTTMGVEFEEIEDIDNVKTKSIDFTGQVLKINGKQVPHFKVYYNTPTWRAWLAGEEGEIGSMLIGVYPDDKEVQFTVLIPSVGGAMFGVGDSMSSKPSVQKFTYDRDIELKEVVVEIE